VSAEDQHPGRLVGRLVALEPLSHEHVPALVAAAGEDPDLYAWTPVPLDYRAAVAYVGEALAGQAAGDMAPFAIIRLADGRVVGSTRFANIERWPWPKGHPQAERTTPDVCEIGYTWLAATALRSGVNRDAKRVMLEYAFETWQVHRVRLRTDVRNSRSRTAIEQLGATFDGVFRADRLGADGTVRDSAVFSVLASEWPVVKQRFAG
jgi:RimJ/RimL family protein N-acetyltransferase